MLEFNMARNDETNRAMYRAPLKHGMIIEMATDLDLAPRFAI
jgi:hypothetical protein